MFFSIIVPVYNVEDFLDKCVKSLLNQDIDDYEIILVNDGSTDESGKICKKYLKYENVKLVEKDNGGLSDARNIGIRHSQGEYLIFVDSDDYIDNNVLFELKKIIENNGNPDLIYTRYKTEINDEIYEQLNYYSDANCCKKGKDFLVDELSMRNLPVAACFSIVKRQLLVEHNLWFYKGILHEDERWSPQVALAAKTICTTDISYYHYVQRDGSITNVNDHTKASMDVLDTCDFLFLISEDIEDEKLKRLFENKISMLYMYAVTLGDLYRKPYSKRVNRILPLKKSYLIQENIKAILFFINLKWYTKINKLVKKDK